MQGPENRHQETSVEPVPLLALSGLTRSYDGVQALAGVDLDLHAGRIHALVGENGAGKSTLIGILAGTVRPDAGVLRWSPRCAGRIAVVHQHSHLLPHLTIAENLAVRHGYPRTALGSIDWRRLRAIGDNERAARFAALPVVRVQTLLYILTGLSSAVAALIFTARVSTAKADAGMGFELEVITAVVLGGTPITGGRGSLWGTFLGVLLLGTLRNGLTLLGVSSVWQAMLAGVVLVATAILNQRLSGDSREITAT